MKSIIAAIAVACVCLTGCKSIQDAGNASYKVSPIAVAVPATDGKAATTAIVCCQVDISDGKERASLDVHVVKTGDNYDITLSEKGVLAFQGQAIAAGATKQAIDDAAKAAVVAVLAPALPALIPAVGGIMASGTTGAALGGAAAVVTANKLLAPAAPAVTTPAAPTK